MKTRILLFCVCLILAAAALLAQTVFVPIGNTRTVKPMVQTVVIAPGLMAEIDTAAATAVYSACMARPNSPQSLFCESERSNFIVASATTNFNAFMKAVYNGNPIITNQWLTTNKLWWIPPATPPAGAVTPVSVP